MFGEPDTQWSQVVAVPATREQFVAEMSAQPRE